MANHINRVKLYEVKSGRELQTALNDYTNSNWFDEGIFNFSLETRNAEPRSNVEEPEPGFRFNSKTQFRIAITYPTSKDLMDLTMVDDPTHDDGAFMSYHQLLKMSGRKTVHMGCINTESKSQHMVDIMRRIVSRNKGYDNYETMKDELGSTCPGLQRYLREAAKENPYAAYSRLYHRCAVMLTRRMEYTFTVKCVEDYIEGQEMVGEREFTEETDCDVLMEAILCDSVGYNRETGQPHVYPMKMNSLTRQFAVVTHFIPTEEDDKANKTQESTVELVVQRNLMAIQVAWYMKKNANMRLERMNVATWETLEKERSFPKYKNAGSVAWMIFSDINGRYSVAVIHGVHNHEGLFRPEPLCPIIDIADAPYVRAGYSDRTNLKRLGVSDDLVGLEKLQKKKRREEDQPDSCEREEESMDEDMEDTLSEQIIARLVNHMLAPKMKAQREAKECSENEPGESEEKEEDEADGMVGSVKDMLTNAFSTISKSIRMLGGRRKRPTRFPLPPAFPPPPAHLYHRP